MYGMKKKKTRTPQQQIQTSMSTRLSRSQSGVIFSTDLSQITVPSLFRFSRFFSVRKVAEVGLSTIAINIFIGSVFIMTILLLCSLFCGNLPVLL